MPQVKLSEKLVEQAAHCGSVANRSVSKQIEYWAYIGKMVEENPDMPFAVIHEILAADGSAWWRRILL